MKGNSIKKLTFTAMFLAIGIILPFFTGQIPEIGSMLLPMHIPVFLCALICGEKWGTPMAFVLPILRSALFGMPPMYPTAIAMAFELAAYAFVAGYLYSHSKWQCSKALLRCLVIAMVAGRVVWGIAQVVLLGIAGNAFTVQAFLAGALFKAIPGIVLQLILIPAVMIALNRTKLVPFNSGRSENVDYAK
ncbi:MAG: ECF transporter S component [Lachnospiraceae bacterium]|nr:ECF transporter S component [Lachnospiraceae bacterium]